MATKALIYVDKQHSLWYNVLNCVIIPFYKVMEVMSWLFLELTPVMP